MGKIQTSIRKFRANKKLAAIVGTRPITKEAALRKVDAHIRRKGLNVINPDAALKGVIGAKAILPKALNKLVAGNLERV